MAKKRRTRKQSLEQMIDGLTEQYKARLSPPLAGLAYRFTIWLPVLSQGNPVFSDKHRALLYDLFHDCCGGFSQSTLEGFPPWSGSWLPAGADKPFVDHHILLIVYSLQDAEAIVFFRQLKWALQQEHVAAQQVVLIEQLPVRLIEAAEID